MPHFAQFSSCRERGDLGSSGPSYSPSRSTYYAPRAIFRIILTKWLTFSQIFGILRVTRKSMRSRFARTEQKPLERAGLFRVRCALAVGWRWLRPPAEIYRCLLPLGRMLP